MPPAESAGCDLGGFWLHTWGDGPRRGKKAPPTRAVGISQETAPAVRAAGQDPC